MTTETLTIALPPSPHLILDRFKSGQWWVFVVHPGQPFLYQIAEQYYLAAPLGSFAYFQPVLAGAWLDGFPYIVVFADRTYMTHQQLSETTGLEAVEGKWCFVEAPAVPYIRAWLDDLRACNN